MAGVGDMLAISSLLGGGDRDDDERASSSAATGASTSNPAAIYVGKDDGVPVPAVKRGGIRARADPKAVWDASELEDDFDFDDDDDDGGGGGDGDGGFALKTPKYEFLYKQAVSTADAFLGMAHNKDPGTRSCEDVVMKMYLPGTTAMRDLDLDVQKDRLRLRSALYKLSVYLPHVVDPDAGKAEWDAARECLKVTMPIAEEDGVW